MLIGLDHPNVVKFYECMYDNHYINIVMELIDGDSLADFIFSYPKRQVPEDQTQFVLGQILRALVYMHQQGITHRDIKPANILVLNHKTGNPGDMRVKIIDFGQAALFVSKNNKQKLMSYVGTVDFRAPEIIDIDNREEGYDESCDLWSVGVLAYCMLSGKPPFLG